MTQNVRTVLYVPYSTAVMEYVRKQRYFISMAISTYSLVVRSHGRNRTVHAVTVQYTQHGQPGSTWSTSSGLMDGWMAVEERSTVREYVHRSHPTRMAPHNLKAKLRHDSGRRFSFCSELRSRRTRNY